MLKSDRILSKYRKPHISDGFYARGCSPFLHLLPQCPYLDPVTDSKGQTLVFHYTPFCRVPTKERPRVDLWCAKKALGDAFLLRTTPYFVLNLSNAKILISHTPTNCLHATVHSRTVKPTNFALVKRTSTFYRIYEFLTL